MVSTDKSKEVSTEYAKLWDEIKGLIECNSIEFIEKINGGNAGEYEKDFMESKFNSDDNLPLNKILKLHNMTTVITSGFQEDGKYPQVFLDECLYEVYILRYDRIDISQGININKAHASKECDIGHYWCFKDIVFKYKLYICKGCHNLMEKAMNLNDVAVASVKGSDFRIHFWYMSKYDAINILKNSNMNEKSGSL